MASTDRKAAADANPKRAAKPKATDATAKRSPTPTSDTDAKPKRERVIPEGMNRSQARKLHCPSCGLVARISPTWVAKHGRTPLCPCDDKTRLVQSNL